MSAAASAAAAAPVEVPDDGWNAVLAWVDAQARSDAGTEGPLSGLRLGVKDNFAIRGFATTCGSRILGSYIAPYTATVVTRAEHAGAEVAAKCNLDEFACGSTGAHSAFGPTDNPAMPGHVTGGSSSGCGAAVAANLVDVAIGSDTGGSVRAPAAWCGIAALKPTNGAVSRWGLIDLAMSLDTPGAMARDVQTMARLHDAMAAVDPRDALTAPGPRRPVLPTALAADIDGVRIGVPRSLPDGVAPEVAARFKDAVERLDDEGAVISEVELPDPAVALATYYVVNCAEFASGMLRYDGTGYGAREATIEQTRALLGDEVRRRILLGTLVTTREHADAWYRRAVATRARIRADWATLLQTVDLVVTPTMPTAPPVQGTLLDPIEEYAADVFTVPANLAGVPAGSVPMDAVEGGPIGLQFTGAAGDDATVVGAMAAWEAMRR